MNTIAKLTVAMATAALVSGTTACSAGPAGSSAATPPGSAAPTPTATFCHGGFPAGETQYCGIKPAQINMGVDAAVSIRQITWSSWNASDATGNGSWYIRSCLPSCVQSPVTKYPATLTLSAVQHGRFTVLTVTLKGHKAIYRYPAPWPQSADGCVRSPYCDQPAGPSPSG